MKMKLNEIWLLNNTLKTIIDSDSDAHSIDSLFKFRLLGILKNLEAPIANFDIIRDEKIKEFGKEDENGNISISPDDKEAIQKFTDAIDKVANSDVEVSIEKLKVNEVFDAGVSTDYLVKLYDIIEK